MPHLNRSRLVIWPCDSALTISARLLRGFCASRWRTCDALLDMYMVFRPVLNAFRTRVCARVGSALLVRSAVGRLDRCASWLPVVSPIQTTRTEEDTAELPTQRDIS